MNKAFIKNYTLHLTPLSPIHIACGEEFEPSNYIIKDHILYHFDPSNLGLSIKQKNELIHHAEKSELLEIQRFFKNCAETNNLTKIAHYIAETSKGIAQQWNKRIGKKQENEDNKDIINQLATERHAYLPHLKEPYIPGSSFKGALATALLDQEHNKQENNKNAIQNQTAIQNQKSKDQKHKKLLETYLGVFEKSKLRYVKFSDFMPNNPINNLICFRMNFKKNGAKNITTRCESIVMGQYRAFSSQLSLWQTSPFTIEALLNSLHQYHLEAFEEEKEELIKIGFVSDRWIRETTKLIENSKNRKIALVRLGKNGSNSKIYRAENMAQIRMTQGKNKGKDLPRASTLWLAGEDQHQTKNLYPFGWALLELDEGEEYPTLKNYCEEFFTKERINKTEIYKEQQAYKQQQLEKQQKLHEEKMKKEEAQRQEEKAQQQKENARQNEINNINTPEQRRVLEMRHIIEDIKIQLKGIHNPKEFLQLKELCEESQTWQESDKNFLIEHLTLEFINQKIELSKKAEKTFKSYGLKKK